MTSPPPSLTSPSLPGTLKAGLYYNIFKLGCLGSEYLGSSPSLVRHLPPSSSACYILRCVFFSTRIFCFTFLTIVQFHWLFFIANAIMFFTLFLCKVCRGYRLLKLFCTFKYIALFNWCSDSSSVQRCFHHSTLLSLPFFNVSGL